MLESPLINWIGKYRLEQQGVVAPTQGLTSTDGQQELQQL